MSKLSSFYLGSPVRSMFNTDVGIWSSLVQPSGAVRLSHQVHRGSRLETSLTTRPVCYDDLNIVSLKSETF